MKRHIDVVGWVLSECWSRILHGLSLFLSATCFFVVMTSDIGSVGL